MSTKEIQVYVDSNIKDLKLDISTLEETIIDLMEEKIEIEGKIYDFNNQYNEKVGPFLVQYLNKREEDIKELIENTDDEEEKKDLEQKLEVAQEDINDFHTYSDTKSLDIATLSKEQEQELKALYKKACRLCHPDMVDDSFKDEALSLFHRLNEANQKKDISKVREILEYLEDNNFLLSEDISDMQLLKKRHSSLKSDVIKLEVEIKDLHLDTTYQKILDIQDWDRYFKIISTQLEKEVYKQEV